MILRDPVHGLISFEADEFAIVPRLMQADEVQRLRRIRQLGMASLAYPGADHSRYSHSVGVMETARKILNRLRQSFTIDENDATVCLCAALLHDVGLVCLNRLVLTTDRPGAVFIHRLTNTVRQKPRAFVGNAECAMQLMCADALFTGNQQMQSLPPFMYRDVTAFE